MGYETSKKGSNEEIEEMNAKVFSMTLPFVLVVFGLSQPASAQLTDFLTSPGYSAMINNSITNNIWNRSMEAYTKNRNKGNPGVAKKPEGRPEPETVPEYRRYPAVQFKPTGTRLTLQEYLDSVNVGSKDKADLKLRVEILWDIYETEAKRKGYPNDLALALVSAIELNSHVYEGRTGKLALPFGQNIGKRDALAEYATDNGTFNSLTDRQKQELYELFIILGGLTYHFYDNAVKKNDQAEVKNAKLAAAQNLKMLGFIP